MVYPDGLITLGHAINFDMGIRIGDKLTGDTITKAGCTEVSMLTRQHEHMAFTGEDDCTIGSLLGACQPFQVLYC